MVHRFGAFTLDSESFELRRSGEVVPLQRRVFDLIAYLVERPDRLITKEELFEQVWGGVAVSEASLAQAVKHARRALGDDADAPTFILTVRGRGYRFAGAVTREEVVAPSAPRAPSAPPPRRELVGRSTVVRTLEDALRDARSGRGGVVLISGEPGIGKTRVLDEAAAIGRAEGARVLWARCYLGDEGAPVLWPWTQILRQGAAFDPEGVPSLPAAASGDPVRARFQLFDAIAAWLRRASSAEPIVILLDDLHCADEPSLLLLKLIAGTSRDMRVLAVGAHRSLARGPLADLIGALVREPSCRATALAGLGEDDVAELIATGLGAPPSTEMRRAVLARTGGNPFFVTQVVRALAAGGGVPDEAIRAHLEMLSPACREVLSAAAVCGVTFHLGPLAAAAERTIPEILPLLDEAMRGGIVVADASRAGRHRFAHALVRDALHAAIPLAERVARHGRIGAALAAQERAGAEESLSEIAYHLLQAAPAGHAAEAASYAARAAEESAQKGAHEDAARLYERALEALDLAPPDPMRRVELMLALGNARFRAGDLPRSKEIFERSAKMARALGAGDQLAEAALGYALEEERSRADKRRIAFLEEGLSAIASGNEARRALVTGRLAVAQVFAEGREAREKLAREAVERARSSGDPAALAFALRCLHTVLLAPDTTEERGDISSELYAIASRLDDHEGELRALACRIVDRLELGRVAEVDADIASYERAATSLGQPAFQWSALLYRAGRALMSGPLDRAVALVDEARAAAGADQRGPAVPEAGGLPVLVFEVRRAQGRLEEIAGELAALVARAPERALRRSLVALAALARGDRSAAARELDALTAQGLAAIKVDQERLGALAYLAEIAAALGDGDRAAALHAALLPYAGRLVVVGYGAACLGPVSYSLGVASRALGRREEAQQRFEEALAMSRALGAETFAARALEALGR